MRYVQNQMNKCPRKSPRKGSWYAIGMFPGLINILIEYFDSAGRYISDTERFIKQEQNRFRLKKEKHTKSSDLSEEESEALYDTEHQYIDDYFRLFPGYLYQSHTILFCSILESRIRETSRCLENCAEMSIISSYDSFGKSFLKCWKNFYSKNFCIYPQNSELWKILNDIYQIRNLFVHSNSDIALVEQESQRCKIESAIKNLHQYGLKRDDGKIEIISCEFPLYVVYVMKSMIDEFKKACINNNKLGPQFWP